VKLTPLVISLAILASSFVSGPVLAAGTALAVINTPTGLSYYTPGTATVGTTAGTSPTIYGGMVTTNGTALGECLTNPTADATCNSCDGKTGLTPCNPVSIHPNLNLKITMMSGTASSFTGGNARVRFKVGTTVDSASSTIPLVGQNFLATIPWNKICNAASGKADCTASFTTTLSVGIDNNGDDTFEEHVDFAVNYRYIDTNTDPVANYTPCPPGTAPAAADQGACDFEVYPGDEKIYLTDFGVSSNGLATPTAGIKYKSIVLFYEPTFAAITNASSQFTFNFTGDGTAEPGLDNTKVTGLVNDEHQYCFALGNQDQAGNISFFTPASELVDANVKKYCATPSQVVGLLDDKHCFIATATYGSPMAPEVNTFRSFRNQFLMTNHPGRTFVKAYYKFGPVAAGWISESPFLKALSLALLWPLLMFAKLSLSFGLVVSFVTLLATTFAGILAILILLPKTRYALARKLAPAARAKAGER
jgi:hypothetical protein